MPERNKKTPNSLEEKTKTTSAKTLVKKKPTTKKQIKETKKLVFPKLKAALFLVLCLCLSVGFFYNDTVERFVNFNVFGTSLPTKIAADGLKVHFMDVGQADAIAIEFPNGKHMLVDSGESKSTSAMHQYLSTNVFTENEEMVFDYFLLTHSDADHSGGAKFVFENYVVNTIYRPKIYTQNEVDEGNLTNVAIHNTLTYQRFVSYANAELNQNQLPSQIIFSQVNLQIIEEDITILFLGPSQDFYGASSYNEYSPIILLEYKEKRILLTGDATVKNETEVLENLGIFTYDIDVLKLGHHGSSTSTSDAFLKAFTPEFAIISVGAKSKYGHPSDVVLERLNQNGIPNHHIYSTFENATIVVGVSLNDANQAVLAIACGYEMAKPWVTWWQLSLALAIIIFVALFPKEIALLNKKIKFVKKKLV